MRVEQLFSAADIDSRVHELARDIRMTAGEGEVFLLGILNGSAVFLSDLLRAIEGPVSYGFVNVVRDVADTETATALEIDFINYTSVQGRDVYLLKDVVSTGVIEAYLLTQLRAHGPRSLSLVALLDRPAARTVDLTAGFRAFEVQDGAFAGYGLEMDRRNGNLPYIGRVVA